MLLYLTKDNFLRMLIFSLNLLLCAATLYLAGEIKQLNDLLLDLNREIFDLEKKLDSLEAIQKLGIEKEKDNLKKLKYVIAAAVTFAVICTLGSIFAYQVWGTNIPQLDNVTINDMLKDETSRLSQLFYHNFKLTNNMIVQKFSDLNKANEIAYNDNVTRFDILKSMIEKKIKRTFEGGGRFDD